MGEAGRTALLARALAGTVDAHPALNDLRILRHDAVRVDELVACIEAYGREEVAAAIDALIGAVRDMLTGLVGADNGNATDRRRQQSSVAWSPRAMTTRTLPIIRNIPPAYLGSTRCSAEGSASTRSTSSPGRRASARRRSSSRSSSRTRRPSGRRIYFTVLGEPTIKMIRYQRQFAFFDPARVPSAVRFVNLTAEAAEGDLDAVLQRIVDEVGRARSRLRRRRFVPNDRRTRSRGSRYAALALARIRSAARAAVDDLGGHIVPDRGVRRRRATASRLHGGRCDPLALGGRRPEFDDAKAPRGQGPRTKRQCPAAHVSHHDAGMQVFPRIPEQQHSDRLRDRQATRTGVPGSTR